MTYHLKLHRTEAGSIRVGKDADFSIFASDPLTLSAKPLAVLIDGVPVYDTGILSKQNGGNQ